MQKMTFRPPAEFCSSMIVCTLFVSSFLYAAGAEEIAISTAPYGQFLPRAVSDGKDGVVVVWEDYRTQKDWDVYAQRVDSAGKPVWKAHGTAICRADQNQRRLRMVRSDNRIIIVWNDLRGRNSWDIYAQAIDLSGNILWQLDGAPVCTNAADQSTQAILSDNAGGAIFVWEDARRSVEHQNLYIQRFNSNGQPRWQIDGIPVFPSNSLQSDPMLLADGASGFYLVWWDVTGYDSWHIMAFRLDMEGAPRWNAPIVVTPLAGMQGLPGVISDGDGGLIVVWQIYENFINDEFYAQRIDPDGNRRWDEDGVPICNAPGIQKHASITSDGQGGVIAVWSDERDIYSDLYAQRIDSDGRVRWGKNGLPICTAGGHQDKPFIVQSSADQFFVAWLDYREDYGYESNDAIYGQQLNLNGIVVWQMDGVPICAAKGEQYPPFVLKSESEALSVVWTDVRRDQGDVYMWRF